MTIKSNFPLPKITCSLNIVQTLKYTGGKVWLCVVNELTSNKTSYMLKNLLLLEHITYTQNTNVNEDKPLI